MAAAVAPAAFLLAAGAANASVVTSIPGGTVIAMPVVNVFSAGPETFGSPSVTWTSQNPNSVFGWTGFAESTPIKYFALSGAYIGLANLTVGSASVVPEPSTWALMLLGFASLGFAGYNRAKRGRETSVAA